MNSAVAPLQLPGYTWDPETRRYFRQSTSAIRQTPASTARAAAAAALAQAERERAHNQETSHRQARAKQARQRKLERDDDDDDGHDRLAAWRNSVLAPWLVQPAKRDKLKHRLQGSHLATKIGSVRTIYPDCLTMDDSIQHISFDETNTSTLRVGTSSGTIATGYLARPPEEIDMYPNDEERWRTGWFCSSKITSLKTCGNRLVATCLGPPAQAIVGTTDDNISLASITLSPRKTSLWTSAISRDVVALGGDRSVLLCPLSSLSATTSSSGTSTPTAHSAAGGGMDAYVTGGRGGGGTVFALEMDEPGRTVWAGVRRGEVKGFDWRSRRDHSSTGGGEGGHSGGGTQGGEVNFSLATPITHLRLIPGQPHQLLVAAMGGQLAIYDLRFLRPPRTTHDSGAAVPPPPRPRKAFPRGRGSTLRQHPAYNRDHDGEERHGGVYTPVSGTGPGPMPVVTMEGHVNTFSTDLGMDVWRDEWVAIAGQDSRLRIFSLRTGGLPLVPPLPSSHSTFSSSASSLQHASISRSNETATGAQNAAHPLARTFSEPIKSLAFSALDPLRLREKDYTRRMLEECGGDGDSAWEQLRPRWNCPSLWVAEGAGVECFSVQ